MSEAQSAAAIIELRHVGRTFKQRRRRVAVLQDINLTVHEREILCLVGESGCGKTTTGKIITALLPPTTGEVLFRGRPLSTFARRERGQYRRALQIIHQDPFASLNPAHTVGQMLSYPLRRHHMAEGRGGVRRRIWELLTLVDLTPPGDIVDKYPHQLSGGQRQRVSIARALTVEPALVVADEAVSMVDVSIRVSLLKTLQRLRDEYGIAVVFITHDLALAKYFAWAGRIAVMYLGRVVEVGPTPDVIAQPAHPYTRALISAIPEADPDITRNKQRMQLRSEDIPSLLEIPPGCPFHPRCPFFVPGQCDVVAPSLGKTLDGAQLVACTPLIEGNRLVEHGK